MGDYLRGGCENLGFKTRLAESPRDGGTFRFVQSESKVVIKEKRFTFVLMFGVEFYFKVIVYCKVRWI